MFFFYDIINFYLCIQQQINIISLELFKSFEISLPKFWQIKPFRGALVPPTSPAPIPLISMHKLETTLMYGRDVIGQDGDGNLNANRKLLIGI